VGVRGARRSPLIAATTVLVLAAGLGLTTAVYSVLREVLLRPLPYPQPARIVQLFGESPAGVNRLASAPQFHFWRSESRGVLESICAMQDRAPGVTMLVDGRPQPIRALRMSAGCFDVFGVPPARGRAFTPREDLAVGAAVVVLSDGFWRRFYGGRDVLGESLWLANQSHEIIGIAARSFVAQPEADAFVPLRADAALNDHTRRLLVTGRLRPVVTLAAARRAIADTTPRFRREHPFALGQYESFAADTLHAAMVGSIKPTLQLLTGAVLLVLVVACANVATLLLSHGRQRAGEVAARTALGASRARIARQLMAETTCLAMIGAALAIPVAYLAWQFVMSSGVVMMPAGLQRTLSAPTVDGHLVFVTMLAGLATAAMSGAVPAAAGSRADLSSLFKSGASSATASWRPGSAQSALLVIEVALALVLLASTAILLDSVGRLRSVDRGFQAAGVITVEVSLAGSPFADGASLGALVRRTPHLLGQMGGVSSAAATFTLPTDEGAMAPFVITDRTLMARGAHHGMVRWEVVSAEYFDTLRTRRLDGRLFSEQDVSRAPAVAVVNRAMALRFWGAQSPLGERITLGGLDWQGRDDTRQIIGVVGDVLGRDVGTAEPTVYVPMLQVSATVLQRLQATAPLRWIVRAGGDGHLIGPAVATALERTAPGTVVTQSASLSTALAEQLARAQLTAQLLSAFASLSVVLVLVGLYGFVASAVAERRLELSIRAALGASGANLLQLITTQGLAIVIAGIGVGVVAALLAGAGIEASVAGTKGLTLTRLGLLAIAQLATAGAATLVAAWPAYSEGVTPSTMSNRALNR
jgi:putative ABC transport system permease protein